MIRGRKMYLYLQDFLVVHNTPFLVCVQFVDISFFYLTPFYTEIWCKHKGTMML